MLLKFHSKQQKKVKSSSTFYNLYPQKFLADACVVLQTSVIANDDKNTQGQITLMTVNQAAQKTVRNILQKMLICKMSNPAGEKVAALQFYLHIPTQQTNHLPSFHSYLTLTLPQE